MKRSFQGTEVSQQLKLKLSGSKFSYTNVFIKLPQVSARASKLLFDFLIPNWVY